MRVVATAGHVDHGKSALVRALTGVEPDRWEEERRRGLTIDLGFAGTTLPSGEQISFVDVPGHERFLGNMLAGLGPAPVVLFVVAVDEGWQAQSGDHRDAVAALGIQHGLIVLTKADLARPDGPDALAQARRELAGTALADAPAIRVSARTGEGLDDLRTALDTLLASLPAPDDSAPVRLWVDRAFAIRGAGCVITGTLPDGTLRVGDTLDLLDAHGRPRSVQVRGLQRENRDVDQLHGTSRAAVNLRGVDATAVHRGDVLLTPGAFDLTRLVDVRGVGSEDLTRVPSEVSVHAGTAAVTARLRPLDARHARLTLERPLPLRVGDRLVLRGTAGRAVLGGLEVLDVDPPELRRRGAAARRAEELEVREHGGDVLAEVRRRGAVEEAVLQRRGLHIPDPLPAGLRRLDGLLVDEEALGAWARTLQRIVTERTAADPLWEGLAPREARTALDLPTPALLDAVIDVSGVRRVDGRLRSASVPTGLGPAEASVARLEERLRATPFAAPEAEDLTALRLGPRELAAAERQGRLLRLPDGVVLLPTAPALAMRELAALPQPFTTSQARQALGTTRRVAIPLLEHLDGRGWTRRLDGTLREVVR
ncbi:selenocysteine-specific translation elongation factor [Brachybacterium sp. EF45031]|uniref:selenocysteine-specific translation elongation factor n=1 Tax=Brachybacterium sillae TaxID=2810536 RepID=UPI00217E6B9F|nr:selenocysteine-specific translation elongation factor [Brachybacterium sillae]MCS6712292.1 selenocysteine-specific translation elongation factor [Brachybacterium sillae]